MTPLRLLIVEDDQALLAKIEAEYRRLFAGCGHEPSVDRATTVEEARQLARSAGDAPYDLVSLDVNLGDRVLTGMDVLDTLRRYRSAWMVVLLTGVETDSSLEETIGSGPANRLRSQLLRDAYTRFPAERVLVVEKPPSDVADDEAVGLLSARLERIVILFEEVSRQRYVFRPIEVVGLTRVVQPKKKKRGPRRFTEAVSVQWQIRYNCGELRTLPDKAGLRVLHSFLSQEPGREVTPEEALINEPFDQRRQASPSPAADPVAAWFDERGFEWANLDESERNRLIGAALSPSFHRYCKLREHEDDEDLTPSEEDELRRIVAELGPLVGAAETGYRRTALPAGDAEEQPERDPMPLNVMCEEGLHLAGADYERGPGRWGQDSSAARVFRSRMKRVKDYLRENGFADMAEHLDRTLMSTGARWSYQPPIGVIWTT